MTDPAFTLPLVGVAVSPATVVEIGAGGVAIRGPELGERQARVAVTGWTPQRGDQVLVIEDGRGETYVIGVLRALREAEGPGVTIERDGDVTRLVVPEGDLELGAARGRVILAGAEGVSIASERDVTARAGGAVALESHDGARARSRLRLDGDAAALEAGVLAARAARLVVIAEEAQALTARLDARIDDVRSHAKRIETRAAEVVEHLGESYREVEGLAQTRAGRIRLVAEGALSALAARAKLKAKEVFAIDGESIHLG